MSIPGGCRCGSCRCELDFPQMPVSYACHCRDCQTMTGSAVTIHTVVPLARFDCAGKVEGWMRVNGEGTRTTHFVCAQCKTRLYCTNEGRPDLAIIRVGTLDASEHTVPSLHMWVKHKQPWIGLPDDAEVYAEAVPPDRLALLFRSNLLS